jgi:hypothetical protein
MRTAVAEETIANRRNPIFLFAFFSAVVRIGCSSCQMPDRCFRELSIGGRA